MFFRFAGTTRIVATTATTRIGVCLQRCSNNLRHPGVVVSTSTRARALRLQSSSSSSSGSTNSKTATATAAPTATTTVKEGGNGGTDGGVPIGASLLAGLVGVGVVGLASFVVETVTADTCLPYSSQSGAQRYQQDTFQGRFCRMLLACDPTLLFHSQSSVEDAQRILKAAEAAESHRNDDGKGLVSSDENRKLWEARRIVEAAIHPDTGEVIPRPFRMSGYVPYNGPICVSMVASTSTLPLLFWSWINQSQNALVNYYNRNASSPMTNETLMKSYTAAVGSALVVAFGLSTFVQKRFPPNKAKELMKFVAFPSAVVASSLNCYVVRSPEITTGVPLMDSHGTAVLDERETSQIAAKCGVESTTVSRALLQAPVYFLPSLLMGTVPYLKNMIEQHPVRRVPITTFLVLIAFGLGLPATVAIFPQISSIDASKVEKKYQQLLDPQTNQPYKVFYYNKGL